MSRFIEIKRIIVQSSRAERDVMKSHFRTQKDNEFARMGEELVMLIGEQESIGEDEVLKKVFKGSNKSGFLMFVRGVILESLIFDINVDRPGEHNNKFRNRLSNQKKLIEGQVLLGKELYPEAKKLFEEVVSKGEKYQHFDQVSEAKTLLRLMSLLDPKARPARKREKEVETARKARNLLEEVDDLYFESASIAHKLGKSKTDGLRNLISKIDDFGAERRDLYQIKYLKCLTELDLGAHLGKYESVVSHAEQAIELVRSQPSVQSTERETELILRMAEAQGHLLKWKDSLKSLDWADHLVRKNSFNHYDITKKKTLIDFYTAEFKSLDKSLGKHLKSKYIQRHPYAVLQFQFFYTWRLFMKDQYSETIKLLIEELETSSPIKPELNLHMCALLFMASYEERNDKQTYSKSMKLISKRLNLIKVDQVKERGWFILKLLNELAAHQGKELNLKDEISKNAIKKLGSNRNGWKWVAFSEEIYPFQFWLEWKIGHRKKSPFSVT